MQIELVTREPQQNSHEWLVTGAAGFIGSSLVEALLELNQRVVGLDNFATGSRSNLQRAIEALPDKKKQNFTFIEGDVTKIEVCRKAMQSAEFVLHHAALSSVPGSISSPLTTHNANVTGFLNLLEVARISQIKKLVFASSSSVYGDDEELPKLENRIGAPLSPYAASKRCNEIYAQVYQRVYGVPTIGLRYFNVFGPRQDPNGDYAAVIPKWISSLVNGQVIEIFGDGETTRDFCFIADVVQANILAALSGNETALGQVFNIAGNEQTSLNELLEKVKAVLVREIPRLSEVQPKYQEFRMGDIRHSLADIGKAQQLLGFQPMYSVEEGLMVAIKWYLKNLGREK